MLVQYVAASALAQSRNDAKAVERALLDEHGDLDADAAWQAVTGRFGDVALMPDAGATDPISKLTVDTHRSMMMGNNGAERRTFFEGRVRDARRRQSVEKLRSICRLAIMNLRSDAVKFSKGAALESEKDF